MERKKDVIVYLPSLNVQSFVCLGMKKANGKLKSHVNKTESKIVISVGNHDFEFLMLLTIIQLKPAETLTLGFPHETVKDATERKRNIHSYIGS